MKILTLMLAAAGSAATALWMAGCASAPQPVACADLKGATVPASAIGLPTQGAAVVAAEVVAPAGSGMAATGAYCKLSADIVAADPQAPRINLVVNMPVNWNRKALMFGGGGFNGTVPPANGNIPAGPTDVPVPLARGYATFSSDSGHQANGLASQDGSFGINDEAVRNFSGDALKKVHDVALALINRHYGVKMPERMYFVGGSTGGREALAVAQKWPDDWDGAIALYPAWNAASLGLQFGRITRAFAAPGAYPNQAKRRQLLDAAMQACDGLDGVADGLISNPRACNAQFDPATATVRGQPLRCAGGAESGDSCLSDAQIAALNTFNTPIAFGYPLASGETQYPGFNTWGSDLGVVGSNPLQARVTFLALGTSQPAQPMPTGARAAPYGSVFWDQWVKYFVTRTPGYDSLSLDPQNPGPWQARISALAGLQDINRTDLSAFHARGGKLLMAHGAADVLVSTRATAQYYERLQASMGTAKVREFARYYEIPGYGHAASTVYNAAWDSLGTLEAWVERGQAPQAPVVADSTGVPGRTRPLCDYPAWPRYSGSGDVNRAASFACASP